MSSTPGKKAESSAVWQFLVLPSSEAPALLEQLAVREVWGPVGDVDYTELSNSATSRDEATDRYSDVCHLWYGGPGDAFPLNIVHLRQTLGPAKRIAVNRLENRDQVLHLGSLTKNLRDLERRTGERISWVTDCHVLTSQVSGEAQWSRFQESFEQNVRDGNGSPVATWWVVKDVNGRSRSKFVGNTLATIKSSVNSRPAGTSCAVQKYIPNLLDLDGSHISVHVPCLVTPDGAVYLYDTLFACTRQPLLVHDPVDTRGLVRRAPRTVSAPGFLPDMELSLEELGRMTAGAVTQQKLAAEVHDLCREIFTCGADKMCISQLQYTFELMEVSFLVNKDGHLHLLNVVSGTTCTEVRGGARFRDVILPRMLEEILQLCIDPIYALNAEKKRNSSKTELTVLKKTSRTSKKKTRSSNPGDSDVNVDFGEEIRKYILSQGYQRDADIVVNSADDTLRAIKTVFNPQKRLQHFKHLSIRLGGGSRAAPKPYSPARSLKDRGGGSGEGPRARWMMLASPAAERVAEALERRGMWRSFSAESRFILGHQGGNLLLGASRLSFADVVPRVGLWWPTVADFSIDWQAIRSAEVQDLLVAGVPGLWHLTRKDMLPATVKAHALLTGTEVPLWMPETHVVAPLTLGASDLAMAALTQSMRDHAVRGEPLWLAKPADGRQGEGISVVCTPEQVVDAVSARGTTVVVQKYLETPMTLHNCVMDLRAFVLVDPAGHALLYQHFLARRNSSPFNKGASDDLLKHMIVSEALTDRIAVLSMAELQVEADISSNAPSDGSVPLRASLLQQVSDVVKWAMAAVSPHVHAQSADLPRGIRTFELLSFDFVLNTHRQVVLVDVNACPSLSATDEGGPDNIMMHKMVEEILQICVDPYVPPAKLNVQEIRLPQPRGAPEAVLRLGPPVLLRDFLPITNVGRAEAEAKPKKTLMRGPSQKGPDSSDAAPNVRGLSQIAQMAKVSSRLLKGLGVGARVVDASAADAMSVASSGRRGADSGQAGSAGPGFMPTWAVPEDHEAGGDVLSDAVSFPHPPPRASASRIPRIAPAAHPSVSALSAGPSLLSQRRIRLLQERSSRDVLVPPPPPPPPPPGPVLRHGPSSLARTSDVLGSSGAPWPDGGSPRAQVTEGDALSTSDDAGTQHTATNSGGGGGTHATGSSWLSGPLRRVADAVPGAKPGMRIWSSAPLRADEDDGLSREGSVHGGGVGLGTARVTATGAEGSDRLGPSRRSIEDQTLPARGSGRASANRDGALLPGGYGSHHTGDGDAGSLKLPSIRSGRSSVGVNKAGEGSSLQVWLLRSKESQREVSAAPSRASEAGSRMRKAASHMPLGSPPGGGQPVVISRSGSNRSGASTTRRLSQDPSLLLSRPSEIAHAPPKENAHKGMFGPDKKLASSFRKAAQAAFASASFKGLMEAAKAKEAAKSKGAT